MYDARYRQRQERQAPRLTPEVTARRITDHLQADGALLTLTEQGKLVEARAVLRVLQGRKNAQEERGAVVAVAG